jgi:hypothetical protein
MRRTVEQIMTLWEEDPDPDKLAPLVRRYERERQIRDLVLLTRNSPALAMLAFGALVSVVNILWQVWSHAAPLSHPR